MSSPFRHRFLSLAVLALLWASLCPAQRILLPTTWLFHTGDDPHYAKAALDESAWKSIRVPSQWESEGFAGYDGFAWYRCRFTVDLRDIRRDWYVLLGKIDDVDEAYINGIRIGSMGEFPPAAVSAWNEQRAYRIPRKILRENNVLAIRVYDMGLGGGISGGVLGLVDSMGYVRTLNLTPGPKASWRHIVTSNGLLAAVINTEDGSVEDVYPRIYQSYDSLRRVEPFLRGLHLRGEKAPVRVSYRRNTHIVRADYRKFTISYFAPFTTGERVLYAAIEGKKSAVESVEFVWDQAAGGLRTTEIAFPGGENEVRKYVLFTLRDSLIADDGDLRPSRARLSTSQGSLLDDEERYMKFIFGSANLPDGLSSTERDLAEQSIAVLKMGQVSPYESGGKSRGQIVASLPPGGWNIAWVRDGCYAILALSRLGLYEEAHDALKFLLGAQVGGYKTYVHSDGEDYGIGRDYQISVCRYFGLGREESDFNSSGPNIELDGFGLFLTAFCDYTLRSRDSIFLQESYPVIAEKVADVLLELIAPNGLIRRDSGPWERHLPGKQYTYTSITGARGLKDFAALSRRFGLAEWHKYEAGANRVLAGIERHLVVGGKFLRGNAAAARTDAHEYFDASSFEAFGLGLIQDRALFTTHRIVYENRLRIPRERRGFRRVNGGDAYDRAEWIFLDMRIASALSMFGERTRARRLIGWVTAQSRHNHNLIAELYGEKTSAYEGAVPMVGFGAGAYLLAISDYYNGATVP
jgi:GH15 family glucan-1,4-alpha-glucosidase